MKRVFLVHRWSGGPNDDWRPWIKAELEKLGFEVIAPSMPDTETPVIEKWVGHLSEVVGQPDEDTYFIGHSIGCQAIMHYLEKVDTKVGGAIFVAGWFNLDNLEFPDVKLTAKPWIETPIDLVKLRQVVPKSVLIISDNDTYNCFDENKQKFTTLGSEIVVLNNAGHISDVDGFTELPPLLDEFKKLAGV